MRRGAGADMLILWAEANSTAQRCQQVQLCPVQSWDPNISQSAPALDKHSQACIHMYTLKQANRIAQILRSLTVVAWHNSVQSLFAPSQTSRISPPSPSQIVCAYQGCHIGPVIQNRDQALK